MKLTYHKNEQNPKQIAINGIILELGDDIQESRLGIVGQKFGAHSCARSCKCLACLYNLFFNTFMKELHL